MAICTSVVLQETWHDVYMTLHSKLFRKRDLRGHAEIKKQCLLTTLYACYREMECAT
jgi:hypothetical protein